MAQLPIDDLEFLESKLSKASTSTKLPSSLSVDYLSSKLLSIPDIKMNFLTSTLILLSPFAAIAAPSPALGSAQDPAAAIPISDAAKSRNAARSGNELFDKRKTEVCEIINVSSYVNCRSGPGTSFPVRYRLYGGYSWHFTCYEEGTCVEGNWFVQSIFQPKTSRMKICLYTGHGVMTQRETNFGL